MFNQSDWSRAYATTTQEPQSHAIGPKIHTLELLCGDRGFDTEFCSRSFNPREPLPEENQFYRRDVVQTVGAETTFILLLMTDRFPNLTFGLDYESGEENVQVQVLILGTTFPVNAPLFHCFI